STNGSMKFDTYTRLAGFKDYFGRTEYGNDAHYDGNWGIYDEYFMNYTAEKLKECPKPFMAGLFTLSSHHPYLIPENTLKKIPQEEDMFLTAIRYTDYCLKNFFQSIENESWYNNTLFIIVADHTTVTRCNYSTNYIGKYRIPFLFYCPSDSALKGKSDSLVQQLDIYPSVIDYLGINDTILAYGSSIFEKSKYKYCINYLSSMYVGYKDSCLLSFDGEQMHGFYEYKNDSMLQKNFKKYDHPLKEELFNATKAIIQDYNHRLINNQLTPDND
ncbi:MAG: sulfatase, partial [Marinilabiliales bacterium]